MKIEKYTKGKNGMYTITLDNLEKVKVHEDLILKYNLLINKEIDYNLLNKIYEENKIYEIYEIALKYLNIKMRSRVEIKNYLKKKEFSDELIENTIDLLIKQGYLDDSMYATSFIHDKIALSSWGPNRIKGELEKFDIDSHVINDKISIYTEDIEKERIENLINKQIKQNHNKGSILLKRKIQTNLVMLGYNINLINEYLNGKSLVSSDVYEKEYKKLYDKLSKKYSGTELEYKLKQKLYQKGFSLKDFE